MALQTLIANQEAWARRKWPGHEGRMAPSLRDNLFVRMSRDIQCQFERGSGGELGSDCRPGKMSSLRSSSAFSYNVFAPWLGRDLAPLARSLDVKLADQTLQFERQFPHGLSSTPPNVDVVLDNQQPHPLGIESKFTEPYGGKKPHPALDAKYFADGRQRWAECGLPRCQQLARDIGVNLQFRRLGAGQLLKHILGLAWTTKTSPRLMYLWFDTGCDEATEHRDELEQFAPRLDRSVWFSALTYQEVFARLQRESEPARGYHSYLAGRYFAI